MSENDSSIKKNLCKNYEVKLCPVGCTFWDCDNFEPTEYFRSGIGDLNSEESEDCYCETYRMMAEDRD